MQVEKASYNSSMYSIAKAKVTVLKPVIGILPKPTPLCYIGPGKVMETAKILMDGNIERVLVLTDSVLFNLGLLEPMLESIRISGIKVSVYKDVLPDPTYGIVEAALEISKKNDCQAVIAFGGGSVLDTSKAVAAAAANHISPTKLEGLLKVKKESLPIIAIPTTAGTGSEVTLAAVISETVSHKKTTIASPRIVPKFAILDPELTTGLPNFVTATTGLDALTHALEAYTNTYANEETDGYARRAIKMIVENLEVCMTEPTNLQARENLLVGSFHAGRAFTRTYVGYVHAFAHHIGGHFKVPHGLCCGILLPHVMQAYREVRLDRFASLSDLLKLAPESETTEGKADAFIQFLFRLNEKLDIPKKLEKFPGSDIETIKKAAFKECHGTYPVPKYFSSQEATEILSKICSEPE
ncbi:MAG: iron-containing alcohol dehydrogenase [Lachnospiraceae bacterium]